MMMTILANIRRLRAFRHTIRKNFTQGDLAKIFSRENSTEASEEFLPYEEFNNTYETPSPRSVIKYSPSNFKKTTIPSNYKNLSESKSFYFSFAAIENQVRQELQHLSKEEKILLKMLPRFGAIFNGLRPHELTIFTGPTGCGKTTVLSQISLDYAFQGVPVLWGSFEIRISRLSQVMMQQIALRPLSTKDGLDISAMERAIGHLKRLPIDFINFFGSTDLDSVLNAMEDKIIRLTQATKNNNNSPRPLLIILDNLQFMLSGQASTALDKWSLMDQAIASLRYFCNAYPVHLILVVHPRKEMDDVPLGLASVSGTAKATQEADNVIILQKIGDKRYLELKKNRYWGELGRVRIGFKSEAKIVDEIEDGPDKTRGTKKEEEEGNISFSEPLDEDPLEEKIVAANNHVL